MKRKLIALAVLALSLGSTAAVADNNYVFDDPYWKRAESATSFPQVQPTESIGAVRTKYDQVDNYIP